MRKKSIFGLLVISSLFVLVGCGNGDVASSSSWKGGNDSSSQEVKEKYYALTNIASSIYSIRFVDEIDVGKIPEKTDVRFWIEFSSSYSQKRNLSVLGNGKEIGEEDGIYTIPSIAEDVSLEVRVDKNEYAVTAISNEKIAFFGENGEPFQDLNVLDGEDIVFGVQGLSKFSQAKNLAVTANGALLTESGFDEETKIHWFTLFEVRETLSLAADCSVNGYTITYHYEDVEGEQSASSYGEEGTDVSLLEGKNFVEGEKTRVFLGWFDAKVGGNKVTSLTYSADKDLYAHYASGYSVQYAENENFELLTKDGEPLSLSTLAYLNDEFSFKVVRKNGYSQGRNLLVKAADEVLTPTSEGVYSFILTKTTEIEVTCDWNIYDDIVLKNAKLDASDTIVSAVHGSLPDAPSMAGYIFDHFETMEGERISGVKEAGEIIVARYLVPGLPSKYVSSEVLVEETTSNVTVLANDGGPNVNLVSKAIKGASNENWLRGKIKGEGYTIGETASSYIEFAEKSIDAAFSGKQNAMRLTLPAVDFSKYDSVSLSIAASDYGGIYLKTIASQYSQGWESLAFASSPMGAAPSYVTQGTITVKNDGTIVFYNDEDQKVRQTFKLSEKVRTGQEGLAFDAGIADANYAARLFFSDFTYGLGDVYSQFKAAYDDSVSGDISANIVTDLYPYLTPYEKTLFSEAKINECWISSNEGIYKMDENHLPSSAGGTFAIGNFYGYRAFAEIASGNDFSMTLPKIDMQKYSTVSFSIRGNSYGSTVSMNETPLFKPGWNTVVNFTIDVGASKVTLKDVDGLKALELTSEKIPLSEDVLSGKEAISLTMSAYKDGSRRFAISDISMN